MIIKLLYKAKIFFFFFFFWKTNLATIGPNIILEIFGELFCKKKKKKKTFKSYILGDYRVLSYFIESHLSSSASSFSLASHSSSSINYRKYISKEFNLNTFREKAATYEVFFFEINIRVYNMNLVMS